MDCYDMFRNLIKSINGIIDDFGVVYLWMFYKFDRMFGVLFCIKRRCMNEKIAYLVFFLIFER